MGNRLSKIYTRTGDDGTTGLASGERISKSDLIFEVMGDVDELNSHIGMVQSLLSESSKNKSSNKNDLNQACTIIQHLLFNLGGEIAMYGSGNSNQSAYIGIESKHISWLEQQIDTMNNHLQPLKDFILPTGTPLMSQLHITRSVCRRAERHAIKLANTSETGKSAISKTGIQFLNRLSDWLFVTTRYVSHTHDNKTVEVLWDKNILEQFED